MSVVEFARRWYVDAGGHGASAERSKGSRRTEVHVHKHAKIELKLERDKSPVFTCISNSYEKGGVHATTSIPRVHDEAVIRAGEVDACAAGHE